MGRKRKKKNPGRVSAPSTSFQSEDPTVSSHPLWGPYSSLAKYLFAFTGLVLSVLYGLTLCPTVPGGDSGELITVAHSLGVAHPPGYPLYTLIAHGFSYFPFGSVAFRINLLSAVFSVAAGLLLFNLIWQWLKDEWAACGVALFFFLSPLVWRYAVVAEVFSLNNLFVILLLSCFYGFLEKKSPAWVWALAATLGLACSHHHTILFVAVPLFLWLAVFHAKDLFRPKAFFPALGIFLAGFIPYLYLPWAAAKKFIFSWGEAETWDGFWVHFLRSEYGTLQLASGEDEADMLVNLGKYGEDLLRQSLGLALLPIIIGLFFFFRKRKTSPEFLKALLLAYGFYMLVFHYLANMDLSNRLFFDIQSRFWMVPNLLLCFFMAFGIFRLRQMKWATLRWSPLVLAAVYFPTQLAVSYRYEDYSKNYIFENVGRSTLESLPPNAIMLMRGDIYVNSVRYLQEVEKVRPDVQAIPLDLMWWPWMKGIVQANFPEVEVPAKVYRYDRRQWDHFTLIEFFEANLDRFPVFIGKLRDDEKELIEGKYTLWNLGYINAVTRAGEELDFETYKKWARAFDEYVPPAKSEIRDRSWEAFVYYNYWDREIHRLKDILTAASEKGFPAEYLHYGVQRLELVIERHPDPPAHIWKNIGVAYQFLGRDNANYIPKMVRAWEKYIELEEEIRDPDIIKLKAFVKAYKARQTASE